MPLGITEETIARKPLEVQAIVRLLLAEIVRWETRIKELESGRKTPQNPSLPRGAGCGHADTRGNRRELYEHRSWLWMFLRHDGVRPTDNAGERSLRHAVT